MAAVGTVNFKREHSDVTAVAPSLVEATTDYAMASLSPQTILPRHTISAEANWALQRLARIRAPKYEAERDRILIVAGDLGRGGSERQMLAVASGLLRRGYDLRLTVLNPTRAEQPNFEEDFRNIGLVPQEVSDFNIKSQRFESVTEAEQHADLSTLLPALSLEISQLMTAIRTHRPQIVHAWLDHAGLAAALAATSLGTPSVVVQYGSMSPRSFSRQIRLYDYFRRGFNSIARNPTVVLANNSASGAIDYERWLRLRPGSIQVVRNGLMTSTVRIPSKKELSAYRSALRLPSNVPVVGAIMRFTEEKDPNLWLAVAAEIAKVAPQVCFVLAGYGELLAQCRARAQAIGLNNNIIFPGEVEDVGLTYALLDVFLLTSKVEGLPNVLIEAQAAGCPVIATDVGGTREALLDGRTGRVVCERSPDHLARAVLEVLFDPTWGDRMNRQANDFVANRFSFDRMVDRTLEMYRTPLRGVV
jgi:glycosyltransferase involved in cell wall biosynthesis